MEDFAHDGDAKTTAQPQCGFDRIMTGADLEVHCPMCGAVMSESDGMLTCPVGRFGVSPRMKDSLRGLAVLRPAVPVSTNGDFGGTWFCPADGNELQQNDGRSRCPICGRYLPNYVKYQFIEFNLPAGGHALA